MYLFPYLLVKLGIDTKVRLILAYDVVKLLKLKLSDSGNHFRIYLVIK